MLKTLIVDDEATMRRGLVAGVNWSDMDCVVVGEAVNGLDALEQVEKLQPDLIITDIRMPQMSGLEMFTQLRKMGNEAYVILLTAYDDFDFVRSALQLGAVDYLLKPFRPQELSAAIARVRGMASGKVEPRSGNPLLPEKGERSKYVTLATDFIARHYADADISITSIATELGVSEGHLSHIFKKETGYTVINYLTQFRIHAAMELLQDCKYKVYQVAEQVGYRDVSYFSSTFKKFTGVSPSDYQEHC